MSKKGKIILGVILGVFTVVIGVVIWFLRGRVRATENTYVTLDSVAGVNLQNAIQQGQRDWASLSVNERHALGFYSTVYSVSAPRPGAGAVGSNLIPNGARIWFLSQAELDRWLNSRIGTFTTRNTHYRNLFGRRWNADLLEVRNAQR